MKTKLRKYKLIFILLLILSTPSIYENIRQQLRWFYVLRVAEQVGHTGENQLTKGRICSDPGVFYWDCYIYLAFTVSLSAEEFQAEVFTSSLPDKRFDVTGSSSFANIFERSRRKLTINGSNEFNAYYGYRGIEVSWSVDNHQFTQVEFYEVEKTNWQIMKNQEVVEGNVVVVKTALGTVPILAIWFGP